MVKNDIGTISAEHAYAAIAEFSDAQQKTEEGAEIYTGVHPIWGPCVVIFPAFGDPIRVRVQGLNVIPLPPIEPEVTIIRNVDDMFGKIL